jgi:sorting nexin-4
MALDDNFDNVHWRDEDEDSVVDFPNFPNRPASDLNGGGGPSSGEPLQAGPNADQLDLAGVGRGVLETTVSDPQTEGEGTKDAYVSYLVTTDVCANPSPKAPV